MISAQRVLEIVHKIQVRKAKRALRFRLQKACTQCTVSPNRYKRFGDEDQLCTDKENTPPAEFQLSVQSTANADTAVHP